MAMLAEPRRKQKVINLRAKNNAWSNDNTKFGQRMLEKMGWKFGKGLGAKENGMTEHVVARYKNDEKGLGFEDKNDQWTKHEDDFNALLANLTNETTNTENLHSGVSLEDKSKKSKARIHYHKFTRGKDISRYSEKDLANIFGKKSFKNTNTIEEPAKDDLKSTEQVFTEKGSMADYFKRKLAGIKSKSKLSVSNVNENDDSKEADYGFHGFSQNTEADTAVYVGFGFSQEIKSNHENYSEDCEPELDSENVKSKRSKNCLQFDNNVECMNNVEQDQVLQNEKCIKKKKKSKNELTKSNTHQSQIDLLNDNNDCIQVTVDVEQVVKKKKKSKKRDNPIEVTQNNDVENVGNLGKRKKPLEDTIQHKEAMKEETTKKTESETQCSLNMDCTTGSSIEEHIPKKKKKKKNFENPIQHVDEMHEETTKMKKCEKKINQNIDYTSVSNIDEHVPMKKKKKKN